MTMCKLTMHVDAIYGSSVSEGNVHKRNVPKGRYAE